MLAYKKILIQSLGTTAWEEGRENFVLNAFLSRASFILSLDKAVMQPGDNYISGAWSSF